MAKIDFVKIDIVQACTIAGLTTMLLGTTAVFGPALAQTATTTSTATASTATTATNSFGGGGFGGGGGGNATLDPGVRGGPPGAGGPLPGLSAAEQAFFTATKATFEEVDDVAGGLGPRFNLDGCAGCHANPASGGSSPPTNPQVALATAMGARNVVPSFITANGPVREVRFVRNPDGTPDGGVHDLFVITGRSDAGACNITQPNFAAAVAARNVIFRIPTPTFGLGLVESTPDATLQAALAANAAQKRSLGISGRFNTNGNDGTITRFGWKAQNKSLLIFSGEAYNVEQGITNEAFPNEREDTPSCQLNATPEDHTQLGGTDAATSSSDVVQFAGFMRLLAPPTPASSPVAASPTGTTTATTTTTAPTVLASASGTTTGAATSATTSTATVARGQQVFANVGCQACHANSLTSGKSPTAALNNKTYAPYSDFAIHAMGVTLADNVSQGAAAGNEFRTAPLWGVGQRTFFLHDGRTNDIYQAIQAHSSSGSEATTVIRNFNLLSRNDQQAVVNFLRSL